MMASHSVWMLSAFSPPFLLPQTVFLLMAVLRKEPYYAFTLKGCVLGRQNKASMGHAVLLDLLHDPRIITVTTTLSMDGGNEPSQR